MAKEEHAVAKPEVADLAGMVAYQRGSIVSRTVIDKKGGTVTLFAFDKGQALSEHTAPYDAMVCVLEGQVEIRIAGAPFTLSAGQMIVMPANQPHGLKALSQFKMMLVMVRA